MSKFTAKQILPVKTNINVFLIALFTLAILGCKKDPVVFDDNEIPPYAGIPTIEVNNYVNRLFIDLIGREPLDVEMEAEVAVLEANDLNQSSRLALVQKLMYSVEPLEGDTSYNNAYHWKLYESLKARFIEGASDAYIQEEIANFEFNALNDSLSGNFESYTENKTQSNRLKSIISGRTELMNGSINIDELCRRMMFNSVYDFINMNSFNFVNASFDDLFFRFPTNQEFDNAYQIIEFNQPGVIFGEVASNKLDYLNILTQSNEYEAGMVYWSYLSLMGREPTTLESFEGINAFNETGLVNNVQTPILISDEYAGFN